MVDEWLEVWTLPNDVESGDFAFAFACFFFFSCFSGVIKFKGKQKGTALTKGTNAMVPYTTIKDVKKGLTNWSCESGDLKKAIVRELASWRWYADNSLN